HQYRCGPEVRNFDQLKVGDIVNTTIVEQVAIYVRKQGTPPNAAVGGMIARAGMGGKPAIIVSETAERTAIITAVNPDKHTLTVKNVLGEVKTYNINPEID